MSLRGSIVGGQESLGGWWCWLMVRAKSSGRPGREPLLELQVVLWFCGGSTEKHCQECRGPASSALQVRGRVGLGVAGVGSNGSGLGAL